MKNGFKKIGEREEKRSINSPFNFEAPPYDQRSSCYVNAGQKHGVGHRQPVGHREGAKNSVPCMPMESKCMMDYQNRLVKNQPKVEID
jgi:hypothetical protein